MTRGLGALRPAIDDVRIGARFVAAAPGFLRRPFDLHEARGTVAERFRLRSERFLGFTERVARRPEGAYARLLQAAGAEPGDVRRLTGEHGVEGALSELARAGVYLTVEEFKGRRPVRRGSLELELRPSDLVSPTASVHGLNASSGSRGPRTLVPIDLAFVADHAVNTHLTLDAHGGRRWTHAHWGVPGGTALTNLLEFAKGGTPAARWFTPVDPAARDLHPRYRLGAHVLSLVGRASGCPLPSPQHVPLDDPLLIVGWMREELDAGRTPHLWTFASSAVLVAQAARAAGISLEGARFTAGGEPTTAVRLATVRASGAEALPRFGTTETDIFAFACRAPTAPDDMHLLDDRHAVVQAAGTVDELPPRALLVTSLLPSAPFSLLNLSLGDEAELVERSCGCPLEGLGWRRHLQHARSFEKLTAGGVTFLDADVAYVLERELPERFGGGPTHYQLVEREGDDGRPALVLLIEPSVGDIAEDAVLNTFLDLLGTGNAGERMAVLSWRQSGLVRVERGPPLTTGSGKLLHVHHDLGGGAPR